MKKPEDMITIGIDPSLTGTGLVVLKGGTLIERRLIKTKRTGDSNKDELERLNKIVNEVAQFCEDHQPDVIAIEGLAFMARNTTALVQLSALNYMLRNCMNRYPCWVVVAPTSLKKFVLGKGSGQKNIMLLELYKTYGVTIEDDNEADAFCLAQLGAALVGAHQKPLTVPQKEVVALISKQV